MLTIFKMSTKGKNGHLLLDRRLGILLAGLILLSSCGAPFVRTVEVTRVVRQTVVVTELLTIVITATPVRSANTETTPLPATSIPFVLWDTQQVVDTFRLAGLEVSNPRPMTSDDYGLVPMLATQGTRFFIPTVCPDCGGRIMSFANQEDLVIVRDYYAQMTRFGAVLFSWVFVRNNILVQINGELPEESARVYEAALDNMK